MVDSLWWCNIECSCACPRSSSINHLQKRKTVHIFFAKVAVFNQQDKLSDPL
uniref:Uncharacterized protein n=1 Tax=Arundo donax TaxID=35708 RepID=A0A0A9DDC6_ARUDO